MRTQMRKKINYQIFSSNKIEFLEVFLFLHLKVDHIFLVNANMCDFFLFLSGGEIH